MPAPTFVTEYETTYTAAAASTNKTVSVTVAVGDYLMILGMGADSTVVLSGVSGGGLTYTLRQSVSGVTNYSNVYCWTATSASAQTFTLTVSRGAGGNSDLYGAACLRFSGATGVGASSKTNVASGAPSLALTTTGDNSAVVMVCADWNAASGSSRAYRSIATAAAVETTYSFTSGAVTLYDCYWPDSEAAGSKTTGLTAPSQKYSIISCELLGTVATPARRLFLPF